MNLLKKIQPTTNFASSLVAVIAVVYIAHVLQEIIVPFIIAALFAFLLYPMCEWLEKKGLPRMLAIVLSIFLLITVIGGIIYVAYTQIITLDTLFPLIEEKVNIWVQNIAQYLYVNFGYDKAEIIAEGQKYLAEGVKSGTKLIGATIGGTSSFLMNMALLPLYIFLMLMYSDFLNTFIFKLLKNSSKHKIMLTINKVKTVVKGYVLGLMLVIFIVGILNTISLTVIGIEHALFFGFFASFLVILPYIGIAIGAALPILVALITKDSYLAALAVAISFAIIQFLEGNFITPYVVGNQVSINALVAITALLLFAKLWGIGGMVLALPVTAILKVIFESSDRLAAWGFLMGDAENEDVHLTKRDFSFKSIYNKVKKKI